MRDTPWPMVSGVILNVSGFPEPKDLKLEIRNVKPLWVKCGDELGVVMSWALCE